MSSLQTAGRLGPASSYSRPLYLISSCCVGYTERPVLSLRASTLCSMHLASSWSDQPDEAVDRLGPIYVSVVAPIDDAQVISCGSVGEVGCLRHNDGGLILYQAYGNLYAMTARGWLSGGNTLDLGSFGEEMDGHQSDGVRKIKTTSGLNQHSETLEDSVKRRRQDYKAIWLAKTLKDSPNEPPLRTYQRWKNAIYEEALRKSDQMHQTCEKSSLAMTHKLDDMIKLPKSQPKKTYKEDLECEMVMVKIPRQPHTSHSKHLKEYTPIVTYMVKFEVEETIGIPMEVEPLDEPQLEDLGLNTCNHDIPLSSMEVPSFDEPEPQPNPLPNCPPLDVSLGDKRVPKPPINPHSLDSFRMKEVDNLTIHTPPSPHVASFYSKDVYCYYHRGLGDPKKHYGFKPGLLGQSGYLGVDFLNLEVTFDEEKPESS
ncbi:hypothetical protein Tco_0875971 [Tanacetum coccineum]|uniref:Uncharacterized protein n=1 Tax=Tanacetum coccineum TaxID=301880 RepID=A0ABQ5BR03_9ASTR